MSLTSPNPARDIAGQILQVGDEVLWSVDDHSTRFFRHSRVDSLSPNGYVLMDNAIGMQWVTITSPGGYYVRHRTIASTFLVKLTLDSSLANS